MRTPALLAILDGVGIAPPSEANAVTGANAPFLHELFSNNTWPFCTLNAAGRAVGLPAGQMGNSEVGHLNIGAGRTVNQELTRIDCALEDGSLLANEVLLNAFDAAIDSGGTVHFMGLHSDGGVHSMLSHLYALMEMAAKRGVKQLRVAAFLDGRDVSPTSGEAFIHDTHNYCGELMLAYSGLDARISMISGRYWAMDRDKRWERVERAWRTLVLPTASDVRVVDGGESPYKLVCDSYAAGVTDEFFEPVALGAEGIVDGDSVVFFNFRPDRAREITQAFIDPAFDGFERPVVPQINYVCMTEYDASFERDLAARVAFPKTFPQNVLADYLSSLDLRQLHIAETEKYAHVTFFFNGGIEEPKAGEQRILIPSPKVATYDLKPQMSALEVTDALLAAIEDDAADLYIVNYANGDMVGHTGVLQAAIAAVETLDTCLERVIQAILARGGVALVTADHGNSEQMFDDEGNPWTAHTLSPVPLVALDAQAQQGGCSPKILNQVQSDVGPGVQNDVGLGVQNDKGNQVQSDGKSLRLDCQKDACLADIAPTLLDLMGLPAPPEFTGRSLLIRY